jgi:CheY-specific phosphatase CheX
MNKQTEAALHRIAAQIFENLGFILSSREISQAQKDSPLEATVAVTFRGPFTGRLLIRIYGAVVPALAANMLGDDSAPSDEMQKDALKEVANVICGNLLPAIAGSTQVFDLDAPVVIAIPAGPPPADCGPLAAKANLGLDFGRAEIELYCSEKAGI